MNCTEDVILGMYFQSCVNDLLIFILLGADGHSSMTKENYIMVNAPVSTANFTAKHNPESPLTAHFVGSVSNDAKRWDWPQVSVIHVYHKRSLSCI